LLIVRWVLTFGVALASYWAGFSSYKATLWFVWHQTLWGDEKATVFWSAIAFSVVLFPLYLLICFMIKWKIKPKRSSLVYYPLFCGLIFVIPTAFIVVYNGGGSLLSPEAQLFHAFFASSGIVFGMGFGLIWRNV
jgi:hypothetical protein